MSQWVHKFLQDEERSRNMVGTVGICVGIVLLVLSVLNTYLCR